LACSLTSVQRPSDADVIWLAEEEEEFDVGFLSLYIQTICSPYWL
jgi:hypothetical protein